MRVLHVITGLGAGGAEQQLRLLLRRMPFPCDVVTLTNPGAVADGIRADGHRVIPLGMGGNRDLSVLPRLVRIIRRGRYDLVHTHLYRACVYGRIAARLAGVRAVIASEHSLGPTRIEGRPLTRGNRALYLATERLGSGTVAVSATVAARLRDWGVPGHRIQLVPNGIDPDRFRYDPAARTAVRERLGVPRDAAVVGGVGRLVPGKRFDALVRACAELPDVWLLLAGGGPELPALRQLVDRLGMAERVRLLGECGGAVAPGAGGGTGGGAGPAGPGLPELPELLSAMDLFVSPSGEEAFGLSVLEALAAGLPVLHVTCPAIDELPRADAPGARRVPPGPAALAAALRQQLPAAPQRQPVPAAVERYGISRSAEELLAVYARSCPALWPGAVPPEPVPAVPRPARPSHDGPESKRCAPS